MFIKETVAISTAIWFVLLLASSRAQETRCMELPRRNVTAYLGWPIRLDCDNVYYSVYVSAYDAGEEPYYFEWRCTMKYVETNETFHNSTSIDDEDGFVDYQHGDITDTTLSEIEIKIEVLENGNCATEIVTLNVTRLPYHTCEEHSQDNTYISDRRLSPGSSALLDCEAQDGDEAIFDISGYNITWCFDCNCTAGLPNDTIQDGTAIMIAPVDYKSHPGVYSCFVSHNGERRYFSTHKVCVTPQKLPSFVSVICPKKITVDEGDAVNITCDVSVARDVQNTYSDVYHMEFFPILYNGSSDLLHDNISCTSSLVSNRSFAQDERASCSFSYGSLGDNLKFKCFDYIPTPLEWENETDEIIATLQISYELKKCTTRDAVLMQGMVHNQVFGTYSSCQTTIEVMKHPDHTALIIGAVGFLVILLIVTLCFRLRLQIRYWWRQTSCMKYKNGAMSKEFNDILP